MMSHQRACSRYHDQLLNQRLRNQLLQPSERAFLDLQTVLEQELVVHDVQVVLGSRGGGLRLNVHFWFAEVRVRTWQQDENETDATSNKLTMYRFPGHW